MLSWLNHKANRLLYLLRECRKSNLPKEVDLTLYKSKIRPIVEYASPVWGSLPSYLVNEIERIQTRSLQILGMDKDSLQNLNGRREVSTKRVAGKIMDDPSPCRRLLPEPNNHQYNLRSNSGNRLTTIFSGTERHKRSFLARACKLV